MSPKNSEIDGEKQDVVVILGSGELDYVYTALLAGMSALSNGAGCTIYFSSWGLIRLKKKGISLSFLKRTFPMGLMMRGGLDGGPISRYNLFGIGRFFFKQYTKKSDVGDIHSLMDDYKLLGGKVVACAFSMDMMNFEEDDMNEVLIDEYGAIGPYIRKGLTADLTVVV